MNLARNAYPRVVTVLEAIQRSTEFLARKGVDSPRLQTELLLAHLLRQPRMRLYLDFERVLTPAEVDGFRKLIQRRGQREPLQHIAGSASFCGLEIAVNRDVLIPRPETELLAERGWTFLNQLSVPNPANRPRPWISGRGAVAWRLRSRASAPPPQSVPLISHPKALRWPDRTPLRHSVAERIRFLQGDGFAAVPEEARFDLIISNPPYIPSAEIAALQPEVRDYDPHQALDGGVDGLDYGRRLAAESPPFLKPQGRLMLEFGDGQAERLRQVFQEQKWIVEAIAEDYTHQPRIMVARRLASPAGEPGASGPQPT